jgi:hypothetical protein
MQVGGRAGTEEMGDRAYRGGEALISSFFSATLSDCKLVSEVFFG